MSDTNQTTQINKRTDVSVAAQNVTKIDSLILDHVESSMVELDGDIKDIDSVMEVLRDRMIEDTDASFPISLARFAEIKLATRKQKNELLKTLLQYKSGEQLSKKRSVDASSSIQDIMAGVGLGAALTGGRKLDISSPKHVEIERTDTIDAEIELEEGETTASSYIRGLNG